MSIIWEFARLESDDYTWQVIHAAHHWRGPRSVSFSELQEALTNATAAGFDCVRDHWLVRHGDRVTYFMPWRAGITLLASALAPLRFRSTEPTAPGSGVSPD